MIIGSNMSIMVVKYSFLVVISDKIYLLFVTVLKNSAYWFDRIEKNTILDEVKSGICAKMLQKGEIHKTGNPVRKFLLVP